MNAFNCPQCGAALEYERITSNTVRCHYCNSTVIVPAELRPASTAPRPSPQPLTSYSSEQPSLKKIVPAIIFLIALASIVGLLFSRPSKPSRPFVAIPTLTPFRSRTPTPTPKPDGYTIAFTFGGEGTGPGFFKDDMCIAVGVEGRIYVSDELPRRVEPLHAPRVVGDVDAALDADGDAHIVLEEAGACALAAEGKGMV